MHSAKAFKNALANYKLLIMRQLADHVLTYTVLERRLCDSAFVRGKQEHPPDTQKQHEAQPAYVTFY